MKHYREENVVNDKGHMKRMRFFISACKLIRWEFRPSFTAVLIPDHDILSPALLFVYVDHRF